MINHDKPSNFKGHPCLDKAKRCHPVVFLPEIFLAACSITAANRITDANHAIEWGTWNATTQCSTHFWQNMIGDRFPKAGQFLVLNDIQWHPNDIVMSNLSAGPALFSRSLGPDGSTVPRTGGVDTAVFPSLRCFLSLSLAVWKSVKQSNVSKCMRLSWHQSVSLFVSCFLGNLNSTLKPGARVLNVCHR